MIQPPLRCPAEEDDDEGDGVEGVNDDDGLMASAEACYKAWKGHFETDAWRASAAECMRAVSERHLLPLGGPGGHMAPRGGRAV